MNDHSAATTARAAVEEAAPCVTRATRAPQAQGALRIVRTIAATREALAPARLQGAKIGFVPTMGALHQGHLSLIEAARSECDLVVVSIFVNPSQFNEQADLLAYPRQEQRDATLAQQAGADILFAPEASQIYPRGFNSSVEVLGITDSLEGAMRGPSHFSGMTTIVCKLLNIVQPAIAYFGQKDAQQAAVVKRMVTDLNIPVTIETMPTVREADGLAMSSRNARLSESERAQARALSAALQAGRERAAEGERSAQSLLAAARRTVASFGVEPEYVEIVDEGSFEPVETVQGEALMLIAARVGQTRLIDNMRLSCAGERAGRSKGTHHTHTQPAQGDVITVCSA